MMQADILQIEELEDNDEGKYTRIKCRGSKAFYPGAPALLLPLNRRIKIKQLETEGEFIILFVKGVEKKKLRYGDLVVLDKAGLETEKELFGLYTGKTFSGAAFLCFRDGSAEKFIETQFTPYGRFHTAASAQYLPAAAGMELSVYSGGRTRVELGRFMVLYPGSTDFQTRKKLAALISLGPLDDNSLFRLLLTVKKYAACDKSAHRLTDIGNYVFTENFAAEKSFAEELKKRIIKLSGTAFGISIPDLVKVFGVKDAFIQELCEELVLEKLIKKQGQAFISFNREGIYNPWETALIKKLEKEGIRGLNSGFLNENEKKTMYNLVRSGSVLKLEGNVFVLETAFNEAALKLLKDFKPGGTFDIGQAKEKLELGRKHTAAVLARLEHEGLVKNTDGIRHVIKKFRH